MKQLKLILSVACAVAIVAPAFATKLSVSGGGTVRFGYESDDAAGTKTKKMGFARKDDFFKINFNVASDDDKLTGCAQYRVYSGGPSQGEGWAAYDFGQVVVKYNANGIQNGWDNDILLLHDGSSISGNNFSQSLNLDIKPAEGIVVFVTAIQKTEGYQDTKMRSLPIMQFGVTAPAGPATITAGIAFDTTKKEYTISDASQTITYTAPATVAVTDNAAVTAKKQAAYVAFLKTSIKATDTITAFVNAAYASNYGSFAAESAGDGAAGFDATTVGGFTRTSTDSDTPVLIGVRIGTDIKVSEMDTISIQAKYSQLKKTIKLTEYFVEAAIAHSLNANFGVKAGLAYGYAKSDATGAKANKAMELYGQATYSF